MTNRSTYVRKIAEGQFEYGFVTRFQNFRKRADLYEASGVETSVSAAEAARSLLTA
jgi:hypothetical protein